MTDQLQGDYFDQVERGLRDAMRRGAHVQHTSGWWRLGGRANSLGATTAVSPRAHMRRRASVALAAAACVAAAAIVLFAVGLSAGTQQAFAGWTPAPTTPATGQRAAAITRCSAILDRPWRHRAHVERPGVGARRKEFDAWVKAREQATRKFRAAARWKTVAVDTRGPYALSLRVNGDRQASCFLPTATPIARIHPPVVAGYGINYSKAPAPGADQISAGGFGTGGDGKNDEYAETFGRAGAGVEGVTLVLADGRRVVTTTEKGWYLAWWPGKSSPVAAEVRTASGTRKRRL